MERENNGFLFNHDLPHENTLDRLGLELKDLDAGTRAKIRQIDDVFAKAMADGYVDEEEEKTLIALSYKVAEEIERDHGNNSSNNGTMAVFGGIMLLIGAAIGIKQLNR